MLRDFADQFRSARSAVVVALLVVPLGGCGIKGPLKPPPSKPAATSPAAGTPPAEAAQTTAPTAPDADGGGRGP